LYSYIGPSPLHSCAYARNQDYGILTPLPTPKSSQKIRHTARVHSGSQDCVEGSSSRPIGSSGQRKGKGREKQFESADSDVEFVEGSSQLIHSSGQKKGKGREQRSESVDSEITYLGTRKQKRSESSEGEVEIVTVTKCMKQSV
jgi:hypothetical protein